MITAESANLYFSNRFWDSTAWTLLDEDVKQVVLDTAESDINAYLGTDQVDEEVIRTEAPFSFYQKAVFEWALFILQNKDEIEAQAKKSLGGVVSRKIDGFGQEVYNKASAAGAFNDLIAQSPAGRMLKAIPDDRRIVR